MSDNIFEKIKLVVDARWNSGGGPLLLSQLPDSLREQSVDIKASRGEKPLLQFVKDGIAGFCQLHNDENNPIVWGLVPTEVSLSNKEIFSMVKAASANRTFDPSYVRYHFAVWKAFTSPVPDGLKRILKPKNAPRFQDIGNSETFTSDFIEIDRSFICAEAAPSFVSVDQKIREWARKNNVPHDILLYIEDSGATDGNLLGRLSKLNVDDLRRISIPLDIVAKLLK